MCPNKENVIDISKPSKSLNSYVSRKLVSISSIKMEAYLGANLVPTAVPDIWCLTFS